MTGALCWIELGISLPVQTIPGYLTISGNEEEKSVPRSGGEKNFVSEGRRINPKKLWY